MSSHGRTIQGAIGLAVEGEYALAIDGRAAANPPVASNLLQAPAGDSSTRLIMAFRRQRAVPSRGLEFQVNQ